MFKIFFGSTVDAAQPPPPPEVRADLNVALDNIAAASQAAVLVAASLNKLLDDISAASQAIAQVSGRVDRTLDDVKATGVGFVDPPSWAVLLRFDPAGAVNTRHAASVRGTISCQQVPVVPWLPKYGTQ